ncbi:hypothetical protein H6B13_16185 [Bacteroides gallinaceum]|uniref:hypothetical protein n=1 Tax=Bacteroides gallinaceum TaxID=1462571 RepID=UPI00195AA69A|nr:hypothetical protein [Bacteroides gallinaceum]MBM6721154.1 hypothetical protein [Bacteroides gallinaceum]
MAQLTIEELNFMLGAMGYLPPRNEEEHLFFEQMHESYVPKTKDRHVDIEAIVCGRCEMRKPIDEDEMHFVAEELPPIYADSMYSMAARNFSNLPKSVIEKIKSQHQRKKYDDE